MSGPEAARPLVGVTSDLREYEPVMMFMTPQRYVAALAAFADVVPVAVPALGDALPIDDLILRLDGVFLMGGRSNVEPHHYGGPPFRPDTLRDPVRDALSLALARAALDHGVPLFGSCRGLQEINVVMGGTLHPYLWEVEGVADHRMPLYSEDRFIARHPVHFTPGGLFARWAAEAGLDPATLQVNSLHSQGIDRLADGLVVEAVADDGVIEGVRGADPGRFVVGVQWHTENDPANEPYAAILYRKFGEACRRYARARAGSTLPDEVAPAIGLRA